MFSIWLEIRSRQAEGLRIRDEVGAASIQIRSLVPGGGTV